MNYFFTSIRRNTLTALIFAAATLPAVAKGEATTRDAEDALNMFWEAFDAHETKNAKEDGEYLSALKKKRQEEALAAEEKLIATQKENLERAIELNRSVLASAASNAEKQTARLNLIQNLYTLHNKLSKNDSRRKTALQTEALTLIGLCEDAGIKDIAKHRLQFLKGLLFDAAGKNKESEAALTRLGSEALSSTFVAYANMTLGDKAFKREDASTARSFYEKALRAFRGLRLPEERQDIVQAKYRLAWSYYREGTLEKAISYGSEVLKPGLRVGSDASLAAIQQDATELIGHALFELNDYDLIKSTLTKKLPPAAAARVSTTILNRYSKAELYEQQLSFGDFITQQFGLAEDLPAWLILNAAAADKLKQTTTKFELYARLASLLPRSSLWRLKNKDATSAVALIEDKALTLGATAADYNYEQGVNAGSVSNFTQAAATYRNLIDSAPDHDESNYWRSREAHCYFFSGNYERASIEYRALIERKKLDPDTLEIVSYQLVISSERQWREAFNRALERQKIPQKDQEASEKIATLNTYVNEFANRFPNTPRSSELLLVMASAYRDSEQYAEARKFWERVLVAKPSSAQRALAIRGLVLAEVQVGTAAGVVALTERFLKLENFKELGDDLRNELEGVLATAAVEESSLQNKLGNVENAGLLLARTAEQNAAIPKREKIYRDGAYMMALSGDWNAAHSLAQRYLDQGLKQYQADMMYLKARSLEYQMRFSEAADAYYKFYGSFPQHKQAQQSLDRAYNLASAEEKSLLAGNAAEKLARQQSTLPQKLFYLEMAHKNFLAAKESDRALRAADVYKKTSADPNIRLKGELLRARVLLLSDRVQAIKTLNVLSQALRREKGRLKPSIHQQLAGEVNYLLGHEYAERYYDYKMAERSGSVSERIKLKTTYYEAMSKAYDAAAESQNPEWASNARYEHAVAAESFANELAAFIKPHKGELGTSYPGLSDTADRLRRLGTHYHTENVLARTKAPHLYRNNQWVRMSALRVSGSQRSEDLGPEVSDNYVLPNAWSY